MIGTLTNQEYTHQIWEELHIPKHKRSNKAESRRDEGNGKPKAINCVSLPNQWSLMWKIKRNESCIRSPTSRLHSLERESFSLDAGGIETILECRRFQKTPFLSQGEEEDLTTRNTVQ
ncbi:hypothetical protein TNCV_590031 [Trichonephila clavipes]|nr:hypothetical protein TNCV_590031 [Trichonephila clavipes]